MTEKNILSTLKIMLNNKSVLITGGTGSFGKAFVKIVLDKYPEIKRLVILNGPILSANNENIYNLFLKTAYRCAHSRG